MNHRDAKRLEEFIAKKGGYWNEHASKAASAPRQAQHRAKRRQVSETWDWETVTDFPGEFEASWD